MPLDNADDLVGASATILFDQHGFELPAVILRSRAWGKKIIINFKELSNVQHARLLKNIFNRQESGFVNSPKAAQFLR